MTPEIQNKIGQLLMFGWKSSSLRDSQIFSEDCERLIRDFRVGSIILMGENIRDSYQLKKLTNQLQMSAIKSGLHPLLISTDQEGGRVVRLKSPPFHETIENWAVGETGDPRKAYEAAKQIGDELAEHGINWNLAPVLDVNNNPVNPVIGNRSYSDKPEIVSEFGVQAIKGYQAGAKIAACAKHFPGHGDVTVDSHKDLPVIDKSLGELEQMELIPFKEAIKTGVDSIMVGHLLLPQIDPDYPATLSKLIVNDLLRNKMGFDGVIVTDCLSMDAISKRYSLEQAAVLAINAGVDIITCVGDISNQRAFHAGLTMAIENGEIPMKRLDNAVDRVLTMKSRLNLLNTTVY